MQSSHISGNAAVREGVLHFAHYVAKAGMRAAIEDCEASAWRVVELDNKAYLMRKAVGLPAIARSQQHAVAFPFVREPWGGMRHQVYVGGNGGDVADRNGVETGVETLQKPRLDANIVWLGGVGLG